MKNIRQNITKALQLIGVSYTKKFINNFIENHSEVNSMLCLSDLFDAYNVENTAGEFDNKAELTNYSGAHISQLTENDISYFVVVEHIKQNTITYYYNGKRIVEPLEEYFKKWRGFVLFFSKRANSAEPNYNENLKNERLTKLKITLYSLTILTVLATFIYIGFPFIFPFTFISLLIIKLAGIGVSILLLSYTYSSNNPIIKGICNAGKKTNCGNILNSKAAKVFSFLSWSEVGLFYFVTTFLTLITAEIQQQIQGYYLLIGVNALALPYTLYSVYYQKKVAKSWCVMCLSIQVLLVLEFVAGWSLWSAISYQSIISYSQIALITGVSVITVWYLIKPLLQANTDLKIAKKDLKKFKQNLPLFHFALSNQANVSYPKQAEVLRFGSPNPKVHFTIFSSPICSHCSKAHITLSNLLNKYPNDIAYTEIFAVSNDDRDERVQITAHMLQLYKENGKESALHAIDDWHSNEDREKDKWIANNPVKGDALNENRDIIGLHNSIAISLGISHTPIIILNGKLLPDLYRVEDLERIIPNYIASLENRN